MNNISEINLYANEFIAYLENQNINLKNFFEEMKNFLDQIKNSNYFNDIKNFLFASPITIDEKLNLLKNFTKNEEILKFIELILRKSKARSLFMIFYQMIKIFNDKNNIKDVKVFSVIEISKDQLEKIKLLIKKYFSCDSNIDNIIDKSIIGGFVLELENNSLDLSIRNQLQYIERKVFV
jgi:F-type H+-transporting ATPase subunit delta